MDFLKLETAMAGFSRPPGWLWPAPVSLRVQRSLMVGSLSNSSLLLIPNHIPISLRLMEGERLTKHYNDGGRPIKRGKVVSGRSRVSSSSAPPPLVLMRMTTAMKMTRKAMAMMTMTMMTRSSQTVL
jgi:hypothetical protein